eukprot:2490125-Pleurochrysis_carterae.AAC.1
MSTRININEDTYLRGYISTRIQIYEDTYLRSRAQTLERRLSSPASACTSPTCPPLPTQQAVP